MVLQVHDELIFDFPIAPGSCKCHPENKLTWQERDERIRVIMERPLVPLGGLRISTEGTSGLTFKGDNDMWKKGRGFHVPKGSDGRFLSLTKPGEK